MKWHCSLCDSEYKKQNWHTQIKSTREREQNPDESEENEKKECAWRHAPNVRSHLIYLCMPITNVTQKLFEQRINRKVFPFVHFIYIWKEKNIHSLCLSLSVFALFVFLSLYFFLSLPKCKSKRMGTWQMLFRHTCVESTVDVLTWRKMVLFISWNCKIALHNE